MDEPEEIYWIDVDLNVGQIMDPNHQGYGFEGQIIGRARVAVPVFFEEYAEYDGLAHGGRWVLDEKRLELRDHAFDLVWVNEEGEEFQADCYEPTESEIKKILDQARNYLH